MVERICIKSIENAFQNWDNNPKDTAWLQRAEKYIKKLVDKKINQVQLYSYLGSIYLKQEKFSKAKKEYENCIELTKNPKLKEEFTLNVIISIMHIVNQKINNRNKDYEKECFEAIKLLQNLREIVGHYNFRTLQFADFFYSNIIENGINEENKNKLLVDLCFFLDIPEISLNFDFQFKILNVLKYHDFESCWVHIVKHSWDYRNNLKWNKFVRDYIDSFETELWNEIYNKSENKELLKLEVWAEYLFALDNITRLYLENGEEAQEEKRKLKDAISNKMPISEDEAIKENSYSVKQEFMARFVKHNTIRVEKDMRECKMSDEIWYSTIKESISYWKLCFAYQDSKLINELQEIDDKTIKASYNEAVLDEIAKKIRYAKRSFSRKQNNKGTLITVNSNQSLNEQSNASIESLTIPGLIPKQYSISTDDEKISFQQSLGACERLSDAFYHLISFILCYDLVWLRQSPIESSDGENQGLSEEDVILSYNSMNIPILIDEQESRIFIFKESHLDLIYKLIQNEDEDFPFPLENYFASDIYIIHDPWSLNKILNICMWHMYDGSFHRYLRFLFPTIPEYINLSFLNNQNSVTLEDITCFLLIEIIQRHIKCSRNKNFFKNTSSVGQTFFLSVVQHPIASVSPKVEKFWYSLIALYGREKYKYMITDIYSQEEIYKIILEIRGNYNTFDKSLIKEIWGLLGLHLMDIFTETELVDHSVEALHYMSLYLKTVKNDTSNTNNPHSSGRQIDPSSVLFEEMYDASELCGPDFYDYVLKKYKILKEKKCTRYESLVKNNQSLINAYINDFDFLSDLEEGQGLMMTSTAPLPLNFTKFTIDDQGQPDQPQPQPQIQEQDPEQGNETLIKTSTSISSLSSATPSSPKLEEVLNRHEKMGGNNRLSRQLKLLQSMKEQGQCKELPKPKKETEQQGIPAMTSTNLNPPVPTTTTPPAGDKKFIPQKGLPHLQQLKKEEKEKEVENSIEDVFGTSSAINIATPSNNLFTEMRGTADPLEDQFYDSTDSDFLNDDSSEEDIIERLQRKSISSGFNAPLTPSSTDSKSKNVPFEPSKTTPSQLPSEPSTPSRLSKRLSRQFDILNSISKK